MPEFVELLPAVFVPPVVSEFPAPAVLESPDELLFSSGVLSLLTSMLDFLIRSERI